MEVCGRCIKSTVTLNIARKVSSRYGARESVYARVDVGSQYPKDQSLARNAVMDKMESSLFNLFKALSAFQTLVNVRVVNTMTAWHHPGRPPWILVTQIRVLLYDDGVTGMIDDEWVPEHSLVQTHILSIFQMPSLIPALR